MTSAPAGEAKTRKELIDPALKKAGWDLSNPDQVGIEIPVDGFDPATWHSLELQLREARVAYDVDLPAGVTDYSFCFTPGDFCVVISLFASFSDAKLCSWQSTCFRHCHLERFPRELRG